MAQPPDISETFLREVDENLRRDQLRDFFKAYGNWLIVLVILFLAASGGFIWWKQHELKRSAGEVEKLSEIYKEIGSGNTAHAQQQLDELSKSASKGVRASALFARAALALQQGNNKLAADTYKSIAGDDGLPQAYRDVALVRQTALEFEQLQAQQVIARLEPLAKPGEPWFGTAGEMTALAMIKQGKNHDAGELLAAIAHDKSVPESIRSRAAQLAGSLGVDAGSAIETQAQ